MSTLEERLQRMAGGGTLENRLDNMRTGTQNAPSSSAPMVGLGRRKTPEEIIDQNRIAAQKTDAPVLGEGFNRRMIAKSSRGEQKGHTIVKQPQATFGGGAGRGSMTQAEAAAGIHAAQGHQIEDFSAAKLVGGAAVKGIDSAMSGITGTADWLLGQNITGAGKLLGQDWSNNPISALNRRVQQAKETNQAYFQPNVERGGRIAEAVDKYGTATAAAIPQAMAAIATAGGSMAAQGTTTGLQAVSAAAKSGGVLSAAQNIIRNLAKDPQYWLSFSQVAGDSYQQAKADGASDAAANLYALANGLGNAAVEVGGGIQTLPKELQKSGSALKAWAESMVDEGKEEVAQGILERGLQNLIYHKKNQLASLTDENAVLNPRTAAEEFAGGAVVGGILGGGQTLLNRAVNPRKSYVELTKDGVKLTGEQKNTAPEVAQEKTLNAVQPPVDAIAQQVRNVADMERALETQRAIHRSLYAEFRSTDAETRRPELLDEAIKSKNALAQAERDLQSAKNELIQLRQKQERSVWEQEEKARAIAAKEKKEAQAREAKEDAARKEAQAAEIISQYNGRFISDEALKAIEKIGAFPQKTMALKAAYEEAKNSQSRISSLWTQLNQAESMDESIRIKKKIDRETARLDGLANAIKTAQGEIVQAREERAKNAAGAVKDLEMPRLETADELVRNKTAETVIDNTENGTVPVKSVIETPKSGTLGTAQNIQQSALDKLGVHPVGDMADYTGTEFLRGENKGEKDTAKARVRAEARLQPSKGEKLFAKGIANGDFTVEDIPSTMNRATVAELADYYQAETSYKRTNGVQKRGGEIRQRTEQMAEQYFKDEEKYKPISMLVMNERTPERVMRSIFGDEQGERINEAYIYPVQQNEAEKTRFIQRQLDQVRTFEDSAGKRSRLTKEERSVVQQMMEDRFVNETVASMEVSEAIKNAAENIDKGEDAADAGREFSLNAEERDLAQRLARWTRNQEMLESGKLDSKKINNAVEKFSEQYDLFYNAVNDFLTAHGYGTIGFIKGYAPHMQGADTQNKLLSALKSLGVTTDASSLPTSISGLTADYKPGKRWNPFFQSRVGKTTDYDVSKGYESYVSYLADILYHTDDIARLRGVSRYLRKTFGPEEINHAIDHAESLRDANLDTQIEVLKDAGKISEGTKLTYPDAKKMMDEYIDGLYDNITKTTKYGEFVKYIENYANLLAGKQSMADRGMEYMAGRTSLNAGNKLVSMFGRAQVAGNLSSVLNQTAQIPQIMAEVKGKYIAQAVSDLAKETGGKPWNIKNTGIFDQSDLLTGKKGIEYLTADDSKWEKFISTIFKPADIMDSTVSALAVQSKYNQLIAEGKVPEAARMESDRWATQVMASRMKGSRPAAFESKVVANQLLHMFQVEALNSFEHLTQDIPARYRGISKQYGKKAASRAIAAVATKGLLSAFTINRIAEAVYGGTPAPFDLLGYLANFFASGEGLPTNEWLKSLVNNVWKKMFGQELLGDEEEEKKQPFNLGAAASDVIYNVSNDIPLVRNAAGILGVGDQTMPFTNMAEAAMGVKKALTAENRTGGEIAGSLMELGSTLLPGGRQLQKTAQGIQTISQGGRTYGYGENQRMQYPVPQTPVKWAQGLMFGNSGLSETRDFYASGDTGLTAKQTKTARDMAETGSDLVTVYDTIQNLRRKDQKTGEQPDTQTKMDRLNEAKLSDDEKLRLYTDVIATSESKRPEEFRNLMKKGMSWGRISEAYTMYLNLNGNDGMSAGEKATRFASWVDGKNLSDRQRAAILDSMAFYSQAKAEAKRYTAMTEAGLSADAAEGLSLRISKLKPETGEQSVSDLQRYNAVVKYGLSEPEQMAALESMMEDSEFEKLENAYNAGVSPKTFVEFKQKTDGLAADKSNGKTVTGSKKAKVLNAINSMQLTNEQKTALYYAAGYKKSTLDDAPWVGGRRAGITMPRLSGGSGGTSRAKTGTALDKYSLGNSLDKYDIMTKLK